MSFRPNPHDELTINGVTYRVAEHPSAPGIPYGQEGRVGIVYRLLSSGIDSLALKVFKPRFRLPYLVSQAEKLSAYADLPGLQVACRTVLTPSRHTALLRQYPDLTYAVLMPWIEGPTWLEIVLEKKTFTSEQSLSLARSMADMLMRMEERGLAHCDLSGPNVMLSALIGGEGVALIDLEGFYAPGMIQPQAISSGSAGYAHQQAGGGLWGADADRFAGAVLLAEMLGWCDPQICRSAWSESYFEPKEMQKQCERHRVLNASLHLHWGNEITSLFQRAWRSDTLAECPTFGEWLMVLPDAPPVLEITAVPAEEPNFIEQKSIPNASSKSESTLVFQNYIDPITSPLQPFPLTEGMTQSKTAPQTSSLAVVSLITGIASWFLIPLIGGLIAIVTGHIAIKKIKEGRGKIFGKGLANTGLILGYINVAVSIIAFGLLFIYFFFIYIYQTGY